MRKSFFIVLATTLTATLVRATMSATEFAQQVQTYVYRPGVFADQYISAGLPSNPGVLSSSVWYIRPEPSAPAFLGMESLAHFLQNNGIPGIDFSQVPTLASSDVERLFQGATFRMVLLKLGGTLVNDDALPALGKLFDLQVLELGDRVSDRGVAWLKDLVGLKVLKLSSPQVTDLSLKTVSKFSHLELLNLKGSGISDSGLPSIISLPLLELDLNAAVTDRGLETISRMSTLKQLDLSQCAVSGTGLHVLSTGLAGLHTLLLGASVTDNDVGTLYTLKNNTRVFLNLKRLDLTDARLTDRGINTIALMTQLEELALTNTSITDASLDKLSQMPHLRYLEISGTRITPQSLKKVRGFPALQVISFSTTQRLVAGDVKPLVALPRLHSLIINGVLIGPDLVHYLRNQNSRRSRWLNLIIPLAYAYESVSDADVDKALQVASAPAEDSRRPMAKAIGLARIHVAESSLDEIAVAPSTMSKDNFQENEKNFLGEFTVGSSTPPHKGG